MEKAAIFLDFPNVDKHAGQRRVYIDYADLLDYLGEGRFVIDAQSYILLGPRNEHAMDGGTIEQQWQDGFLVHTKMGTVAGDSFKCNCDVELTIDILRTAHTVNPDIIVLCSGDGDFVPLVLELRKMGIRVEVAAFESTVSIQLKRSCSGFISLDQYVDQKISDSEEDPFDDEFSGASSREEGIPSADSFRSEWRMG